MRRDFVWTIEYYRDAAGSQVVPAWDCLEPPSTKVTTKTHTKVSLSRPRCCDPMHESSPAARLKYAEHHSPFQNVLRCRSMACTLFLVSSPTYPQETVSPNRHQKSRMNALDRQICLPLAQLWWTMAERVIMPSSIIASWTDTDIRALADFLCDIQLNSSYGARRDGLVTLLQVNLETTMHSLHECFSRD